MWTKPVAKTCPLGPCSAEGLVTRQQGELGASVAGGASGSALKRPTNGEKRRSRFLKHREPGRLSARTASAASRGW